MGLKQRENETYIDYVERVKMKVKYGRQMIMDFMI